MQSRVRRFFFPVLERRFTYASYESFVSRLADRSRYIVVPLCELEATGRGSKAIVGLRHDVDDRIDSALELAAIEHRHGLRSTYFVLHTAPYWERPGLLARLRTIQDDYAHEIGWHNDLVTLQCVHGIQPVPYLERQLERLRSAGIAVVGVASHGSPYCYRFGYHNNYFFSDFDEPVPGFPHMSVVPVGDTECVIERAPLARFGFEYEAYHLDNELYFSDSSFDRRGARWHTDELPFDMLTPGSKTIVLTHPCHWDRSSWQKLSRLGTFARRELTRRTH